MEKRRVVSLSFVALVAVLHLVGIAGHLEGHWRVIYSSYFSDLVIPFAAYFLLSAAEAKWPWCRPWQVKLALAILVPAIDETAQYLGIAILGSTFDPVDYAMYVIGALTATLVDTMLLKGFRPSSQSSTG